MTPSENETKTQVKTRSSDAFARLSSSQTNLFIQSASRHRKAIVVRVVLTLASDVVLVVSNLAVLEVVAVVLDVLAVLLKQ
jgi:hypothetical protein